LYLIWWAKSLIYIVEASLASCFRDRATRLSALFGPLRLKPALPPESSLINQVGPSARGSG
jgi:hypothetical protein